MKTTKRNISGKRKKISTSSVLLFRPPATESDSTGMDWTGRYRDRGYKNPRIQGKCTSPCLFFRQTKLVSLFRSSNINK